MNYALPKNRKRETLDACIVRSQSAVCIYCPYLLLESYPSTLTKTSIKKSKLIGHLHDVVILLTMTLILQGLLSCAN